MKMKVFGEADPGSVEQLAACMKDERAVQGALMADHHLGYSMPIGGVVAYDGAISPSGVGFDIGCGNKAVELDMQADDLASSMAGDLNHWMRQIQKSINFGMGGTGGAPTDHELFDDDFWPELEKLSPGLREIAQRQLGSVGSGNHYIDLLEDIDTGRLWVACHFGSRGFGHKTASGFLNLAAGREFTKHGKEADEPVVFDTSSWIGGAYLEGMRLAGEYAYAGRDFVVDKVVEILGRPRVRMTVHNHHNYAWLEDGLWVVRKGATPLTRDPAFIGGSMGDISVIVQGVLPDDYTGQPLPPPVNAVQDIGAIGSAPHGAGRLMSRTKAAGKMRKMWVCTQRDCSFVPVRTEHGNSMSGFEGNLCPECGSKLRKMQVRDVSTAAINWGEVRGSLKDRGIVVLGAGADEAPAAYKDLGSVLDAHSNIRVVHRLSPLGVVMAGPDVRDDYRD